MTDTLQKIALKQVKEQTASQDVTAGEILQLMRIQMLNIIYERQGEILNLLTCRIMPVKIIGPDSPDAETDAD